MTACAVYTGRGGSRLEAEQLMIETRVRLHQIDSPLDPKLDQFKYSSRYSDPVCQGFPIINAGVNRLAASLAPVPSCMSSNTAQTFGINTIEPWPIQVGTKIEVGQEVSEHFMKNLHAGRRARAENPFVPTRYQGTDTSA